MELTSVPKRYKLVRDFQVGERVVFRGVVHTIFALGDRKGTFDIHQPGKNTADRWLNVPPDQLSDPVDGSGVSVPPPSVPDES